MDALQDSSEGLSRAPSDLSVNGKVCRPADGRASADLCAVPVDLPLPSNASSSSGGGGSQQVAQLSTAAGSAWRLTQARCWRRSSPFLSPRGGSAILELPYRSSTSESRIHPS